MDITYPPGSTEPFVYSDEEISPKKDKITISAGEGISDTEVFLKTVYVKDENAYEPTYLTRGVPVTMDVEKGAWFKVGVNIQKIILECQLMLFWLIMILAKSHFTFH